MNENEGTLCNALVCKTLLLAKTVEEKWEENAQSSCNSYSEK